MKDSGQDFEVEKVLKRRIKKDRLEYYLKWMGYGRSHNTWEPVENLACPDLLNDFIVSKVHKILSARTNGGSIQYLVSWKDGFAATVFESDEVKQKWPVLLLNFLESRLHIFIPTNPTLNVVTFPLTESNVTGDPKVVHYVSNVGHEINYWTEFSNGKCKFVNTKEVKEKCPLLAIAYLEGNLNFN